MASRLIAAATPRPPNPTVCASFGPQPSRIRARRVGLVAIFDRGGRVSLQPSPGGGGGHAFRAGIAPAGGPPVADLAQRGQQHLLDAVRQAEYCSGVAQHDLYARTVQLLGREQEPADQSGLRLGRFKQVADDAGCDSSAAATGDLVPHQPQRVAVRPASPDGAVPWVVATTESRTEAPRTAGLASARPEAGRPRRSPRPVPRGPCRDQVMTSLLDPGSSRLRSPPATWTTRAPVDICARSPWTQFVAASTRRMRWTGCRRSCHHEGEE